MTPEGVAGALRKKTHGGVGGGGKTSSNGLREGCDEVGWGRRGGGDGQNGAGHKEKWNHTQQWQVHGGGNRKGTVKLGGGGVFPGLPDRVARHKVALVVVGVGGCLLFR